MKAERPSSTEPAAYHCTIGVVDCSFGIYLPSDEKLADARNHLQVANKQLNGLNEELRQMNSCLSSTNIELSESNQIKEEYIARFIKLCSTYINRLDAYRRMVNKKVSAGQIAELLKITRSQDALDEELEELYANFDTAFCISSLTLWEIQ